MAANKAPQKSNQKPPKKGSKLASLKTAILNATKRKAGPPAKAEKAKPAAKHAAPAKKAAPAPAAKPAKAAAAPAGKKAAPAAPAPAKKGAAPAAAPAKAAKPAKEKAAKGKKAKDTDSEIRMAGPSIRTSYDANGEAVCREVACDGLATSAGYCRMHYIKNWKKIKRKELILKEGKLNQYIEELVAKYPDKYIEAIRQDLANDKDFAKVIYDLDLDESVDDFDVEGENLDSVVGDIKRDFDDEGDTGF
jgi:hypothetical protein